MINPTPRIGEWEVNIIYNLVSNIASKGIVG